MTSARSPTLMRAPAGNAAIDLASKNELRLEVRNSGPTINEETLIYVFEPLKQGLRETASPNNTTSLGLGLYIAREIVTAHKGTIEVHSADRQTVFTVRLPR